MMRSAMAESVCMSSCRSTRHLHAVVSGSDGTVLMRVQHGD